MAQAKINEKCIIGMPTCGYAFNSTRMAFIAAPSDDEFQLEIDILTKLLEEKDYEAYVAIQRIDPGKFAFCTKICSKIITSQFCIILLNSSSHRENPDVKIPNPNVHLEYGLMLAFNKYVLPLQREGEPLAFNIRPLDTIIYNKSNFSQVANKAIDAAILGTATTARPSRAIASSEELLRYLSVRGLRVSDVSTQEANQLYRQGSPLGFILLDGGDIVYFGMFDLEPAKEVIFRVKLLLQNLNQTHEIFENMGIKSMSKEAIDLSRKTWERIKIEVLISEELDKKKIEKLIINLTKDFKPIPWKLLTFDDINQMVKEEYDKIGDV